MTCQVFEDEPYYICHDGRKQRHMRTETREQDGYTRIFEVYGCLDCSGCGYKAQKDAEKNKIMKINEQWEALKEESHENIKSGKEILKRQLCWSQTEGHFEAIKKGENFRRFHYRFTKKVYKEFMPYMEGQNINKYHCFLHNEIQKFEGKTREETA